MTFSAGIERTGLFCFQNTEDVMRDHRRLRAFQLADELAMLVYSATCEFPKHELFGLTSQMRRAAVSVASNIVEGCARHTHREYVRFLDVSYGSACELQYQASLAFRLGYFTGDVYPKVESMCSETARVLSGLLQSLRRDGGDNPSS